MATVNRAQRYALVVIGGGVFGLSTAWWAARRGWRTLVLERGPIPNPRAASYGPSRKIRAVYGDVHYARLARDAMRMWREIEDRLGVELFVAAGNLYYSNLELQPDLDLRAAAAREAGSPVEIWDTLTLRRRAPQLRRARRAVFEPDSGFVRASRCVEALHRLCLEDGAEVLTEREVTRVEPSGSGLLVRTHDAAYLADHAVAAAGGWSTRLFPELSPQLWQCQLGLAYVHDAPTELHRPAMLPFACVDDLYYGFPAEPGAPFKVARHALTEPLADPDFDRSTLPAGFVEGVTRFMREDFGLDLHGRQLIFDSCMYNLAPQSDFLIDWHPQIPNLLFATAGSGHGFKFGSNIGRVVVDRMEGVASPDWSPQFSFAHFRETAAAGALR